MNHFQKVMTSGKTGSLFVLVGIIVALMTSGCGGGKKNAETTTTTTTNAAPTEAKPAGKPSDLIKAPEAFSDPTTQDKFEELFNEAKDSFAPPAPGMLIRVKKTDGSVIIGELIRFTKTGLVINTPEQPVTIEQADIDAESQTELFYGAFAESMAKQQLEVSGGQIAAVIEEEDPSMIPPSGITTLEIRTMNAERFLPRTGPGRHFAEIPDNVIYRGTVLRVLEDEKDWICVQEDKDGEPIFGWIPKHASAIPLGDSNRERVAREVETMKESGFLVSIDPQINEAQVDSYLWRVSDSATVEGKGRLLARYCGQQKNVRVYFVVIKDAQNGRKLAEYSESRGFKVF